MTYGLIVNNKELKILDENKIEYSYWDGFDLFSNDSEQIKNNKFEIEFDNKQDMETAFKLIRPYCK